MKSKSKSLSPVVVPRLVRFLGSKWLRMMDNLPNQSKEYLGWKSWLIVARMKTMATWMNASGSISDSWRMAVKSYPINSLQCLPYRHRNVKVHTPLPASASDETGVKP